MKRLAAVLALTLALGALAVATVRVDSDARALLGGDAATERALDTPEGRALTVAIVSPDRDARTVLARQIAADLTKDPLVARVTLAPASPSQGAGDWLWQHRFALAPPPAEAFSPQALASEMRGARAALTTLAGAPFAARYLLDPTGSYRRIIDSLKAARALSLPVDRGVPQARDDSAALFFVELADRPFDVAAQAEFDSRLRDRVQAAGAEALLVGPRSISAAISQDIAGRAQLSSGIASALVLAWLAVMLRSARGIVAVLLPPALGFAVAVLAVQAVFGSAHVLALGFGGALMGLAADYPLHLMAHGGRGDAHVRHCVRLGAATTSIAFLSLTVAGIPAIGQVGLFVAVGLAAAATAALWVAAELPEVRLGGGWSAPFPGSRHKLSLLFAIAVVAAAGIWMLPDRGAVALVDMPPRLRAEIGQLDRMIGLPSGRHAVEVTGATLGAVLDEQARLRPELERAQASRRIGGFEMLSDYLPERPATTVLPTPEALSEALAKPMAEADLRPDFRNRIVSAYRAALAGREVRPDDAAPVADLAAAGALVRAQDGEFRAPVLLRDVREPDALKAAIDALDDPAIRFVDRQSEIVAGIDRLTGRVRLCLGIGIAAALAFLLATERRRRAVVEIVTGCAAAALATAWLAGMVSGGLDVFQVMALALVVGIGIDYGLLLTLSDDALSGAAARSVLLCASTTLIAFISMALSGVGVLEDMGTTVAVGVIAMLLVSAVRSRPGRPLPT